MTSACSPGRLGRAAQPEAMSAAEARGEPGGQCRVVSSFGEPLIVDWESHHRANVEEAMQDGVAVVAYDCRSLRLLKGCRLDGSYGFMSVSKKEELVRFENTDEITASMPGFGIPLARQLRADLERGSTLDLAMILVGKRRTTLRTAPREKLVGGALCEGATHFVRGAFVGAFAMGTGTRGNAGIGMGLFQASSTSSRVAGHRDGEAAACSSPATKPGAPPQACDALLRLELVAIGQDAPGPNGPGDIAPATAEAISCPAGTVFSAGRCTVPKANVSHQCKPTDVAECERQCSAGNLPSCGILGEAKFRGIHTQRNVSQANQLLSHACTGGDAGSCNLLGVLLRQGELGAKEPAKALPLHQFACDQGLASGCFQLASMLAAGEGTTRAPRPAVLYFSRACEGGDAFGCRGFADALERGDGTTQDTARAAVLFKRACDGGVADACRRPASATQGGGTQGGTAQGVPSITAAQAQALVASCRASSAAACAEVATRVYKGDGYAQNKASAASLYVYACDGGVTSVCAFGGWMHETGDGIGRDTATAGRLYRRGCGAGDRSACEGVARVGAQLHASNPPLWPLPKPLALAGQHHGRGANRPRRAAALGRLPRRQSPRLRACRGASVAAPAGAYEKTAPARVSPSGGLTTSTWDRRATPCSRSPWPA